MMQRRIYTIAIWLPLLALVAPSPTRAQDPAPAAGTMQFANLPPNVREALFAGINAYQNWLPMRAVEHFNRVLAMDSTIGLARVFRAELLTTMPDRNAEFLRGTADAAASGRGIPELTYLLARRAVQPNASRLFATAALMFPSDRRIALDNAVYLTGRPRLDSLRSVTRRFPDFAAPYTSLAYALAVGSVAPAGVREDARRYHGLSEAAATEALAAAQKAVSLAPTMSGAHLILGRTLLSVGRPTEALPHLDQATRLDSKNDFAWFLKADIYARDGQPRAVERARAAYDSAIAADPNYTNVSEKRHHRAMILLHDGKVAEFTSEMVALAADRDSDGARGTGGYSAGNLYANLAVGLAGARDAQGAEKYLAEARRLNGDTWAEHEVDAYSLLKRPVEARRALDAYVRAAANPAAAATVRAVHRLTAFVLLAEGKPAEAITECKLGDNNIFCELITIEAHQALGNTAEANAVRAAFLAERAITGSMTTAIVRYRATNPAR